MKNNHISLPVLCILGLLITPLSLAQNPANSKFISAPSGKEKKSSSKIIITGDEEPMKPKKSEFLKVPQGELSMEKDAKFISAPANKKKEPARTREVLSTVSGDGVPKGRSKVLTPKDIEKLPPKREPKNLIKVDPSGATKSAE